jgi:hypothetical protein
MPEHGDYNPRSRKWYCNYWQSSEEWEDIHDYAAPDPSAELTVDPFSSRTPENLGKSANGLGQKKSAKTRGCQG